MATSKSDQAKAAWAKARRYAKAEGIAISEARSRLARKAATPTQAKRSTSRTKKRVTPLPPKNKELLMAEQELRAKYPHIVEGSLRIETDSAHKGRRSVEIACQRNGCQERRRIHTSDAFQTKLCPACTTLHRKQRRTKANQKGVS
jgi:hypothetical protein